MDRLEKEALPFPELMITRKISRNILLKTINAYPVL